MSRQDQTRPSLTGLFGRILAAQWAYVGPWRAVFFLAAGFHIASVVRLDVAWSWLPAAALAIGGGLLVLLMKIPTVGPEWGGRQSFASVLEGIPGVWDVIATASKQATFAALMLCALPAPAGVIFVAVAFVFGGYFFSRPQGFYRQEGASVEEEVGARSRPDLVLRATTIFFAAQAVALLLVGLSFNWHWRACALASLLLGGGYVFLVVGAMATDRPSRRLGVRRKEAAKRTDQTRLLTVPLLIAPLLISFWSGDRPIFLTLCAALILGAPLLTLYMVYLERTAAERACKNAFLSGTPHELLEQAVNVTTQSDDDVLGSDGYYRILRPDYIPLQGSERGQAGFVGWIKSNAFSSLAESDVLGAEWIAFRGISGINSPVAHTRDELGERIHTLMGALIPVSQHKTLRGLADTFDRQVPLSVVRNEVEQRLLKCPWDNPEVLLIPLQWQAAVNFPPACGLFDSEGKPCYAKHVQLSLSIRKPIREAVVAVTEGIPTSEQIAQVRRLLGLFQRILPSCFEALLLSTILELRKCNVPILELANSEGVQTAATQATWYGDLRQQVETRMSAAIPPEIDELVECSIGQVPIDSYLLPEEARKQDSQRQADQRNAWTELQKLRRGIFEQLEMHLLGSSGFNRGNAGEVQLAKLVDAELNQVSVQLESAKNRLLTRFKEANINETNFADLPRLQAEVSQRTRECLTMLEERRHSIHEAFFRFNDAFRSNSSK